MIISPTSALERRLPWALAGAAAVVGVAAWIAFLRLGLVLSHYDAKAHLVVARRVIDSLTPGWQQVGAVWLPLPHLIQILPSQIDFFYRTGACASFVSLLCLAASTYAIARLVLAMTGSALGSAVSAALFVLNPNLLYLHTTPMTEPLMFATTALAVLWLVEWVGRDAEFVPGRLRLGLFAAAWTRYEAWAIVGAALVLAGCAMWRRGGGARIPIRLWRLGVWPAAAIAIFLINSRITVGAWFVGDGFYVPDPTYEHQGIKTIVALWWGTHQLSGYAIETIALFGAAATAWRALRVRDGAPDAIPLAFFAAVAVPFVAFYSGHPYRIRYLVPAVGACALFGGVAVGYLARRKTASGPLAAAVTLALGASLLFESPPWNTRAPLLLEAQWDYAAGVGRQTVTGCLARQYHGERILASMGSLAHYMQELSAIGLDLKDFVHEGNGALWNLALQTGPAPHAGWMLVEEVAEGGDVLAARLRRDPTFGRGMTRACEGGGVALYRR